MIFALSSNKNVLDSPKDLVWIEIAPPQSKRKNQIVQNESGEKVNHAPRDSFLGKSNRKVKEESISKNRDNAVEMAKSRPASKPKQNQKTQTQALTPQLGNLGIPMLLDKNVVDQNRPEWEYYPDKYGETESDYVKDLKETDFTALNTREFTYYSYFQRVRRQLNQAWKPIIREQIYRIYRLGRRIASNREHTTKTLVVLDSKGAVIKVQVLEQSGTRDLDKAAVDAFNQAGPFPNPPQGMIDQNGMVKIRWDFILGT